MKRNPRGYPDEIELKVRDEVGPYSDDQTFNTEDQQRVARDIQEHWPIEFKELASMYDYSRQMVPNVLEKYFGPPGEDITFGEIEETYASYEDYEQLRKKGLGEVELPDDVDLTKRELDLYVKGQQDGFEDGWERGFEAGLERGKAEQKETNVEQ